MGPVPKQYVAIGLLVLIIGAGALILNGGFGNTKEPIKLDSCASVPEGTTQIVCILRVIKQYVVVGDLAGAFKVFDEAYRDYRSFAASGCHIQAHRVGDMAYYNYYTQGHADLDAMQFPQSTTACGYGFFHGFIEHMVQDHPDPAFVTQVCEDLRTRLSGTMHDIGVICYHGSGHGFTRAQADALGKDSWGNLHAFIDTPVTECDALQKASPNEKEDCKQGIFNVMVDWMESKEYGFSYDALHPFAPCDGLPAATEEACYYEMAQRVPRIAGDDPQKIMGFVAHAPTEALKEISFSVGIAGVIQDEITKGSGYGTTLTQCDALNATFYDLCVDSIVWGLYEHGEPQHEYVKALAFCSDPAVAAHGEAQSCYQHVADRLPRFYTPAKIKEICTEFPPQYRNLCLKIDPKSGV
jgi:hypothetical protein